MIRSKEDLLKALKICQNATEYDKLKEARAYKAALNRYSRGYFNIVIDSVPLNEDEINSAGAASQRRKEQHGNPEQE